MGWNVLPVPTSRVLNLQQLPLLRATFNVDVCGASWIVRCRVCSAGWLFDREHTGVAQLRFLVDHGLAHKNPLAHFDLVTVLIKGGYMQQDAIFVLEKVQALTKALQHAADVAEERSLPGAAQWARGEVARLKFTAELVQLLTIDTPGAQEPAQ
jgi:hypothetical protein